MKRIIGMAGPLAAGLLLVLVLIDVCAGLAPAAAAPQAVFAVTHVNDSGPGSLRQALTDANAAPGQDLIDISAVGTLSLASPLPLITDDVEIAGPGADLFFIDGQGLYRGLNINLVDVTLSDLTIQNGQAPGSEQGGGIRSLGGLELTRVNLFTNTAQGHGGAIYVTRFLTTHDVVFQNNRSLTGVGGAALAGQEVHLVDTEVLTNTSQQRGGGIYILGQLQIEGSLFQGNQCLAGSCDGGALYSFSRTEIDDTTFFSNTAGDYGGGIAAPGILTLTRSVVRDNRALSGNGGGLFGQDVATISQTSIVSNSARGSGGGIYMLGSITLTNSLIDGNYSSHASGGGLAVFGPFLIDSTRFLSNQAGAGGALFQDFGDAGRLQNSLLVDNLATSREGSAVLIDSPGTVEIVNATIGGRWMMTGTAVSVISATVQITNTIIVEHDIAISNAGGIVHQDYNLLFGNGQLAGGLILGGAHSIAAPPLFENRPAGDFRLTPYSPAVNGGTAVALAADFEGDERPLNGHYDIGFDELDLKEFFLEKVQLPVVVR